MKSFIILSCVFLFACDGSKSTTINSTQPTITTQPNEVVQAPTPVPTQPVIKEASTLDEELQIVRNGFDDSEVNKYTAAFIKWSMTNLRFTEIDKIETTFEKVMKDPDEERGKKICFAGEIIEIKAVKILSDKIYVGEMYDQRRNIYHQRRNIYHFMNVGSSGNIDGNSFASACGIIIGTYSYPNSGGGTTHTVNVVGMFDLPENNPSKKK